MGDKAPKEINKLMKDLEPVLKKITVPGMLILSLNQLKIRAHLKVSEPKLVAVNVC